MAKALYGTLFDWIVLQVNHALAIKQSNVKEVIKHCTIYNIHYCIFYFGPHSGLSLRSRGQEFPEQLRFLGNCPLTPPLS